MCMETKKRKKVGKKSILNVLLIAVTVSVAAELILVALLAYLMYQGVFGIEVVQTASAVIKVIGSVCAACICAALYKEKRIIFCPLASLAYTVVCFLVLSAFSGGLFFGSGIIWDLLLSCGAGLATAVIANMKK